MSDGNGTKVITLICERAVTLDPVMDSSGKLKDDPNVSVVKFPCSGMIQPLMVEAALKAGASGVIVCGCQIGDCYYREGNRMIRERLLGERPPGLKKTVDRRRVIALWLSRPQTNKFVSEAKEFIAYLKELPQDAAKPAPAAAPAAKPAADRAPAPVESKKETAQPEAQSEPKTQASTASEVEKKQEMKEQKDQEQKS